MNTATASGPDRPNELPSTDRRPWFWSTVLLIILLLGYLGYFGHRFYLVFRNIYQYKESRCEILSCKIIEEVDSELPTYYRLRIGLRIRTDKATYETVDDGSLKCCPNEFTAEVTSNAYRPGTHFPCWYDPHDPTKAVLRRADGVDLAFHLLPFGCLLVVLWAGAKLTGLFD